MRGQEPSTNMLWITSQNNKHRNCLKLTRTLRRIMETVLALEFDCAWAIFELAVNQPVMDMPELLMVQLGPVILCRYFYSQIPIIYAIHCTHYSSDSH